MKDYSNQYNPFLVDVIILIYAMWLTVEILFPTAVISI